MSTEITIHAIHSFHSFYSFFFLLELEGGHRKGAAEAGGSLEVDLAGGRVIDEHVGEGDPDEELLALDTCHLLHPTVLNECRDVGGVRNGLPDLAEDVLAGLLLAEPDEAGRAVVADLDEVVEREEALWEGELLEELHGFLLAEGVPVVDLGVLAIVFDDRVLRAHLI
eukprot:TRINITY_DN1060_c0_g1_i2.p1 TRINITY_DN1060_c0_g1~~TRINITY_DN1060_c0_g1_i2.p1  ORF type:complete len:168 (-),score=24.27 TRINITY_DN1060_c0_g1_i2:183-686(-)